MGFSTMQLITVALLMFLFQHGHANDLSVLLELKSVIAKGSTNSTFLSTWDMSNSCSLWEGIECLTINEELVVTNLTLMSMSIAGTIPTILGQLTNLQYLDLSFNRFEGQIPESIGDCKELKYMDFSGNMLSGKLPSVIGRLTSLESVVLHKNRFDGTFPSEILLLGNLSLLSLYDNNFSDELPTEIGQLQKLQYLYLSNNSFSGSIPQSLGGCRELVYLTIFKNSLTGVIPPSFSNLTKLETLDISINRLEGPIPEGVRNFANLETFYANDNRLTGSIPDLQNCTKLQKLNLATNNLSGTIPSSFVNLTQLERLWLFDNLLTGQIPQQLGRYSKLNILYLSNNDFEGFMPPDLCKQQTLARVYLQGNRLSGLIPPEVLSCPTLERLLLSDNLFSGKLPSLFSQSLQLLDLSKNVITGIIPSSIAESSALTTLLLSENHLSGNLPQHLEHLQRINISNNMLSGEVQPALGQNLSQADLSSNLFTGNISTMLQKPLIKLGLLHLQNNRLNGELPRLLGSSQTLYDLNLGNNNFVGDIPSTFGSFQALQFLNLSHNQLQGEIPKELGNLNLVVVDLSHNHLSGVLPTNWQSRYNNSPAWFAGNPFSPLETQAVKSHQKHKVGIVLACLVVAVFIATAISAKLWLVKHRSKQLRVTSSSEFMKDVLEGTNNFSSELVIGEGSYGIVYKAMLKSGTVVAVKRLKQMDSIGSSAKEWETAGMIRHRNVVKLHAVFKHQGDDILIYDWLENGSLGDLLYRTQGVQIPWRVRSKIASGTAQGLSYLHHDCKPPIVHRDIKANNILLDAELEPKIGDFGLAKLVEQNATSNTLSYVAGTWGYIAPEYAYTLRVTEMSDVYSYGVVLLELLVGKAPTDPLCLEEFNDMPSWVKAKCNQLEKVVDPSIWANADDGVKREIELVLKVALLCTNHSPGERPTMRQVVQALRCLQ